MEQEGERREREGEFQKPKDPFGWRGGKVE